MNHDIFEIKLKRYGLLNPDKTIYYIELGDDSLGFFAVHRFLLEALYFADICGMVPVVKYKKNFLYAEELEKFVRKNPFEYYYKQPCNIGCKEAKMSQKVVIAEDIHLNMVRFIYTGKKGTYDINANYLNNLARIQRKYIRLNEDVEKYVNDGVNSLIRNQKVLGVHIRGTDFKKNYNIHPIYVTENQYIERINEHLKNENWDKVFIATDDLNILKKFKTVFGDKVIYYGDTYRTEKETSVAFSKNERRNHKYKLGLEVIRDAYTLAACEGIIAGISQVSICARIIKLSKKEKYLITDIIENGYNKNNRNFIKRGK